MNKFMGNKLELFARQKVESWDCWGNEVEHKSISDKLDRIIMNGSGKK